MPGDALQCVLIDKLPFPPPNDPLVEARVRQLRRQGRNPFDDYFVAEAAVSLKQGAGRLIRTETDRGLLVVCDPRMRRHGLRPAPAARRCRRWGGWTSEGRGAGVAGRAGSRPLSRCRSGGHAEPSHQSCHQGFCSAISPLDRNMLFGKFLRSTRSASSRRVVEVQLVVALHQDVQRFFGAGRLREVGDRLLRAVGGRHIGAAPEVVARHVHFVFRQRVDDVVHALAARRACSVTAGNWSTSCLKAW